jgi:hypothetical protein
MTPLFVNAQFFLTQLRTEKKEVAYYIGIQVAVSKRGPGQMPSNPGEFTLKEVKEAWWIYSNFSPFIVDVSCRVYYNRLDLFVG